MIRTLILSIAACAALISSAGATPLAPIEAKPKLKAQATVTGGIVRWTYPRAGFGVTYVAT